MRFVDFRTVPLWINVAIFAVAAALVWIAGTRLAHYADAIGRRTKLTHAFLGMILLGVATSLPEIATTVTAASLGSAALVTGNLFGGVALQTAVLPIVDLIGVKGPLAYFTPQPVLLLQGVMLLLLLALALAGASAGEPLSLFGVGLTPVLLAGGYVLLVRMSRGGDYLPQWRAVNEPEEQRTPSATSDGRAPDAELKALSNRRLYLYAAGSGLVILCAGWALAQTGDALAEQTNLGASFVGVALVAASTSLPELSTTLAAVRRGNHEMAVTNIFGTNCLEVALFFLADLVYREGPILAAADRSALFAATLAMVVTCLYLMALLERRDRTIVGMGIGSLAVLVVYVMGLVGLYSLRGR